MAPASGADPAHGTERLVRVFCDADVLIAGAASTTGASHILLQLSELTLIECVSSPLAVHEAERNIAAKLPAALPAFREILDAAIDLVPEASPPVPVASRLKLTRRTFRFSRPRSREALISSRPSTFDTSAREALRLSSSSPDESLRLSAHRSFVCWRGSPQRRSRRVCLEDRVRRWRIASN